MVIPSVVKGGEVETGSVSHCRGCKKTPATETHVREMPEENEMELERASLLRFQSRKENTDSIKQRFYVKRLLAKMRNERVKICSTGLVKSQANIIEN